MYFEVFNVAPAPDQRAGPPLTAPHERGQGPSPPPPRRASIIRLGQQGCPDSAAAIPLPSTKEPPTRRRRGLPR